MGAAPHLTAHFDFVDKSVADRCEQKSDIPRQITHIRHRIFGAFDGLPKGYYYAKSPFGL
jgi:hypothetical protein